MRKISLTLLILIGLPGALPSLLAAQDTSGIESLMSAQERSQTGIDSLSPAELEALNDWLQRKGLLDAPGTGEIGSIPQVSPAPVQQAVPVSPPATSVERDRETAADDGFGQPRERNEISSRISGEFNGWSGRTTFRLDNGQVWQQRRSSRWKITLDNPEVIIKENFMGAYEMEVVAEGRSIGVRRLR